MGQIIGIVGKPSSGKTTFLNALCGTHATPFKTGNYPFTTIDHNTGVGYITRNCACKEINVKCNPKNSRCEEGTRFIPIKVIDVAGLVPGAHEGRGLGNKFLSELSEADILIHVIDISGNLNEEGEDVTAGSYDPKKDVQFLEEEIAYWISSILKRGWEKAIRQARTTRATIQEVLHSRLAGLKISKSQTNEALNKGNFPEKLTGWTEEEILKFSFLIRQVAKPIVIAANKIDRPTSKSKYEDICQAFPDYQIIPTSALAENMLNKFASENKIIYNPLRGKISFPLKNNLTEKEKKVIKRVQSDILDVYDETGIQKTINICSEILNLIVVFPVADTSHFTNNDGDVLPDAFLVKEGLSPRKFAGQIHADLEKGFICAIDGKTKRKLGDSYKLKDGDVIKIMSQTS